MTRRTAIATRGAAGLFAAALGAALLATSGSVAAADPPANNAGLLETTLHFLTPDGAAPIGVRRDISPDPPRAREALRALLKGPTARERRDGLWSAIPARAALRSLHIDRRATAVVDLSGLTGDADAVARSRVIAQLARTLIGLSGIERVRLLSDGEPWGLWRMDGTIADVAYGYDELLGFFHICAAQPGTEAVAGDCFTALP